ncbi:MAG TPA: hypothetical protein VMF03_16655 [Steroidobacteraceae bacterium]|nr:hypothetical protein [Steroidobacteraceae bacterium]
MGEHLADLIARERDAGFGQKAAEDRARAVLGTDSQLVKAMIERTPRSLTARAPWAVLALMPLLALVVVLALIDGSMFRVLAPVHAAWPGGIPNSETGLISAAGFFADYLLGPLVAVGCIALALRQRVRSGWLWVGLALIALFSGTFGFYMNILPPGNGHHGGAVFSALPSVVVDGHVNDMATRGVIALRAAILFIVAVLVQHTLRTRQGSTPA